MKQVLLSILAVLVISAQALAETIIIDARTPDEFATEHVKGAKNIDVTSPSFTEQIKKLDKNKEYKVYCRSGNRSGRAASIMKDAGFKKVTNIGGLSYIKSDYPTCNTPNC